jgi:hypothetical protein
MTGRKTITRPRPRLRCKSRRKTASLLKAFITTSTFGDIGAILQPIRHGAGRESHPQSRRFSARNGSSRTRFLGYHHEWGPGVHTLFLGGYLNDTLQYSDPNAVSLVAVNGGLQPTVLPTAYHRDFSAYTAELQQIFQTPLNTLVVGGRYQEGWMRTTASEENGQAGSTFSQPDYGTTLDRYVAYGYETLNLLDQLQLTGGMTYDYLKYPVDIENAPISTQENSVDQFSPKAVLFGPSVGTRICILPIPDPWADYPTTTVCD